MKAATLPALIQRFFTDRLCVQMEASRHTVASYRDTFRLLLRFASTRHGKPPAKLTVEDVDADLVADFSFTVKPCEGILRVAATRDWPQFARSSAMLRWPTPHGCSTASVSSRCPANAT